MSLIITVGLAIVVLAVAAGLTARYRSIRALVLGLGLAAFPVGLYLTGLTDLTLNGIRSLIDWFQRTPFTDATAWGIGLAVGGIVVFVVGLFLPKGHKPAPSPAAPQAEPGRVAAKPSASIPTAAPTAPAPNPGPAAPAKAQPKGLDPEDAEIEALLRKRGIM